MTDTEEVLSIIRKGDLIELENLFNNCYTVDRKNFLRYALVNIDSLKFFLRKKHRNDLNYAFFTACRDGNLEAVKQFIEFMENVENIPLQKIQEYKLENKYFDLGMICIKNFNKSFHLAAICNHIDIINYLLQKGYSPNDDFLFSNNPEVIKSFYPFCSNKARQLALLYYKILENHECITTLIELGTESTLFPL